MNAKEIWDTKEVTHLAHHSKLNFFLISPRTGYAISPELEKKLSLPHRMSFFFFVYRIEGARVHNLDFKQIKVEEDQVLFILPNQIHAFPSRDESGEWFKMALDENCLSLLPSRFPFLSNPLNKTVITIDSGARQRVIDSFKAIEQLLHYTKDKNPVLILSHLNALLTELNVIYMSGPLNEKEMGVDFQTHLKFRAFIDNNFKSQPGISDIARELCVSEHRLYVLVKHYEGVSPKEYLTRRIVLEAKRCLFYNQQSPKEIAHQLGFNDANYFFRLFKKNTGTSVTAFLKDLRDMSFLSKD